jgi:hypothetical protein
VLGCNLCELGKSERKNTALCRMEKRFVILTVYMEGGIILKTGLVSDLLAQPSLSPGIP